mgnify:CR=1 FL=1
MKISRNKVETPNINNLSSQIVSLQGPCVGCTDCTGMCQALIDALTVPDLILSKSSRPQ